MQHHVLKILEETKTEEFINQRPTRKWKQPSVFVIGNWMQTTGYTSDRIAEKPKKGTVRRPTGLATTGSVLPPLG